MTTLRVWTVGFIAAYAASACGDPDVAAPKVAVAPEVAERVEFASPSPATDRVVATLLGEVVLPPDARQRLAPPLAGRIVSWRVALGDTVQVGEVLASVRSLDLADLAAEEDALTAIVAERARAVRRLERQVEAGFASATEIQEQRLAEREARARLGAVRSQRAARRELGGEGPGEWAWRAPSRGVVADLTCAVGATVAPGDGCLVLFDSARAELRVRVPEAQVAGVGPDTRARLSLASAPEPPIQLAMARIAPEIAHRSRTRAAYFRAVADADLGPGFVPGATGRVDLVGPTPSGAWRIPRAALTAIEGDDVVFVATADEEAGHRRVARPLRVSVIGRAGDGALVTSEALTLDTEVAVRGVFLLKSLWMLDE